MYKIFNALGFQSAWWACMLGAGHGQAWAATAYCCVVGGVHLQFSTARAQEARLVAWAMALGMATDSLLQLAGVVHFAGASWAGLSPFWLWALWGVFGLTLNSSLAFLQTQARWVAGVLGAIWGPLTYYAGANLGAATLDVTATHSAAMALVWALVLPALVQVAKSGRAA